MPTTLPDPAAVSSGAAFDDSHQYDAAQIEPKWREAWRESGLYKVDDQSAKPNWFSLTMYPYPSGILHVGHWYAFAIPDTYARLQRMRGHNVLFPMGFDSFGLPAENAAIRHNIHPATWTVDNIAQMRRQYDVMGAMIDWSREVSSCEPEFYRWNQWIFLQMLERGLVYRAAGAVWWCPHDQTVLANEQVLEGNICDRCGNGVVKRDLEQWFFRITDYADELLTGLDDLDWPERVKTMQRNWIGRSEGARLTFSLETGDALEVFTTRPDTVFGATFMVLAPEHPLVRRLVTDERRDEVEAYIARARGMTDIDRQSTDERRTRTGVFIGAYAVNPVNDEKVPIWIADYVLMSYGTGAIMGVPAHDERDFTFARAFDLPIRIVIQPDGEDVLDPATMPHAYTGPGRMVNSGQFDGTPVPDSVPIIISWLDEQGRGRAEVSFRLRDWLISRQRYWGTPIPVVYCDGCGIVPVPLDQLPVVLPLDAEFTPTGQSPLMSHEDFLHTTCPTCGGPARRETDTMDTFVDSSWYWNRYTSPHEAALPFDPERAKRWTPVDLYCGGIEHAILHLLYSRFITKVLRDIGLVDYAEPFTRLRNQGMILSAEGTKMSKSRGTQIGPDDLVATYGADALRLHLMFLGPWEQGGPWNDRGITGMERFIRRAFLLVSEAALRTEHDPANPDDAAALRSLMHRTIKRVTTDLDAFQFNTMIAALIECTNELMKHRDQPIARTAVWQESMETLTLLMAPSTPYAAEEMWSRLGKPFSVHQQTWPTYEEALAATRTVEIPVQVNGKVRDRITVPSGTDESVVVSQARASARVQDHLAGKSVVREIFVQDRMINFVVK
ncbi:MAG: Leucyl-tRNA synthetase [uncultured Thermomicrobiales bacterium]|uniref:Leucine--tRNA ligase n=1 Tax=uncultured Thermomicrobiales bacterium TaxID=1645740 RepID=A0A6J4VG72_9BACT|nr:MAG: Leucyl-tRNA synthetase [uncultured Thermomicrobiales bacterium]